MRKIDAGDGSYPSVNTCVHYLKVRFKSYFRHLNNHSFTKTNPHYFQLPDYSSEAVMKERLLAATNEKGFHLN